jgi:predicted acyltransferase
VRIPGVLQRIAVCYFVAAAIYLYWGLRGELAAIAGLLMVYWLLMGLAPVPGGCAGGLEKEGNFAQHIDNLVLNGPVIGTHVWKTAKTWDPEGIISTLPAIATCLFGVLSGRLLRTNLIPEAKTSWLFTGGCACLFAGQVMNFWLPINKSLWTSSYSVFMAGMAMVCFAFCYWLMDVQGWRRWGKPFAIYGMNAITVFVLAGVLGRLSLAIEATNAAGKSVPLKAFLYDKFFEPFASPETAPFFGFLASPKNASLLWALMYVLVLYLVAYVMYRRRLFVRF